MKLYILRHGETVANAQKVLQGQTGGLLSAEGQRQAQAAAKRLAKERFDLIIVSDLKRAVDTAQPIIKTHPEAEVAYEPRLRECDAGLFEGKPLSSIRQAALEAGVEFFAYKPEGGESILEFKQRVRDYTCELLTKQRGKNVLVISHGGVVTNMLLQLLQEPEERFHDLHPQNAALSILRIREEGKHEVEALNCVKHL